MTQKRTVKAKNPEIKVEFVGSSPPPRTEEYPAVPSVGESVLYCIRSDDGVLIWRKAEVIAAENGVCLCVTLIPREPVAAAARITRPQGWALHGYVLDALEGDTVGRYTRKP
jgi:hypothetical protein